MSVPRCGEWWIIEPLEQDKRMIARYGDNKIVDAKLRSRPNVQTAKGVVLECG
ncbi:MAG TPA: hypothetical protein VE689_10470 [Candidatus Udaeobacter sp.]|jgi:hypothetical protein|nr:hypothetical protein [Candidatus Udaeobacter sp.]